MQRRRLGKTALEVSVLGLGCWQFAEGSGFVGGFWEALEPDVVQQIVGASLAGGIDWFDTAEVYGGGRSERALAKALGANGKQPGEVTVATKWWPMLRTANSIGGTIDERLACLAPYPIDLHQVHQPFSLSNVRAQMDAMAHLVEAKKVRAVGVSNFNAARMRAAHAALATRGVPLATNQVKYSLLDRRIESNGVMAAAKELGVSIIAYSPLEQGLLSGKFHDDPSLIRSRPGPRKWMSQFRAGGLEKSRPVVEELRAVARAHGVTSSQVALNWLVNFHGDSVVAIPGASRPAHVEDNVASLGFTLSPAELERIDNVSRRFV